MDDSEKHAVLVYW